jgi:toxin YoeB
MNLSWSNDAWEDYLYWQATDKKIVKRINEIIKVIKRHPFEGVGSPEPLKHSWTGYWSRRINLEHRIVYKQYNELILIAQCRHHY